MLFSDPASSPLYWPQIPLRHIVEVERFCGEKYMITGKLEIYFICFQSSNLCNNFGLTQLKVKLSLFMPLNKTQNIRTNTLHNLTIKTRRKPEEQKKHTKFLKLRSSLDKSANF